MPQPIRTAIAGLGRSGWDIHANLLAPLTDLYRVIAVVDGEETRREEARARFGCSTHTDFGDLVANDDIELIVVALPSSCTPTSLAGPGSRQACGCEKPMTIPAGMPRACGGVPREPGPLVISAAPLRTRISSRFAKHRFRGVGAHADSHDGEPVRSPLDWQTLQAFRGGSLNNTGPTISIRPCSCRSRAREVFCDLDPP